jgi:hypothetical protein
VNSPCILLITNNYSTGWHVEPLTAAPPGQNHYELIPADWTLQAIPLTAGQHRLRIAYSPLAFRLGAWVSSISVLGFLTACIWLFLRRNRPHLRTRAA